jgi:meiotic recombination protein REC8
MIVQMNQEDPFRDEVMVDLDLDPNVAQAATILENDNQDPNNHQSQAAREIEAAHDPTEIFRAPSRKRPHREIILDEKTTLRSADLIRSNEEYLANMAQATTQKKHNRLQKIVKKNATFWVYGQGLGSVGMGLGGSREPYPLNMFSGESLFKSLGGKGLHPDLQTERGTDDEREHTRASSRKARTQDRGANAHVDQLADVEFARQAPSSVLDDASSQMPWNISASVHSSGRAQRFGSRSVSIGDPRFESSTRAGVGVGVAGRYKITSASPLAGRGHLDPGHFNIAGGNFDDDLEITRYLENELASDRENVSLLSNPNAEARLRKTQKSLDEQVQYLRKIQRDLATLDRESLNFYEFIRENVDAAALVIDEEGDGGYGSVAFADILPPSQTTRVVATQAFMNVLTLATEGWLVVCQDRSSDGDGYGWERCRSGDIFMRVVEGGGAT